MNDLKFGDICVCDLTLSLNTPNKGPAPLIYLKNEKADSGATVYQFCRVGKKPALGSRHPFIVVSGENGLRNGCAVYPTQTILFSDESAIIKVVGQIEDEETLHFIQDAIRQQDKKDSESIVMSLCPRCRDDFMLNPQTVVKRVDPYSHHRSGCDYCQSRSGYLYLIYKKKTYRSKEI